jgi:hypothetical protein
VPYILGESERRPLQRYAEGGVVGRDGDVDLADLLTLFGVRLVEMRQTMGTK